MTLFGIDISRWQAGIDLREVAKTASARFVIAKCSEGEGVRDPNFNTYRLQAQEAGLLFAGYHFVRGDSSAQAQISNIKGALSGTDVPVILDIERTNGFPQPNLVHYWRLRTEAKRQGVVISDLTYFPEWYWFELGRLAHDPFPLWHSRYGTNSGLYFGDKSPYWSTMGRQAEILQFTDKGRVSGYGFDIDRNAFRGTREELAKTGWLKDYSAPEEHEMSKEEIQQAVRTTPIVIDHESGETQTLERVLRRLLTQSKQIRAATQSDGI